VVEISRDVLIYDIETRTFGKPDSSKDLLRIFGCYSYKTDKYYLLTDKQQIQKIIDAHRFLVGFNNAGTKFEPGYDNPVLIREGINFKYKTIIDLRNIFRQRASQMKIKKGMLGDLLMEFSLDFISKMIGIVDDKEGKMDIDYSIFQKDTWSKEETELISKYTKRDVEVTKKLYEWVEEYFYGFREFITEEDVKKKVYLTQSMAKLAYKAICKAMKWEEEKGQSFDDDRISGGYVSYPAGEQFEGDIYCLDFNSLYPHIMIQCNLYGRCKNAMVGIGEEQDRETWFGGGKWKVEGAYYSDKLSGVCELLKNWYADRVKFKKERDRREYTLKIFINIIYGILNNPYYAKVYDRVAGGDCTRIGRQWIKYARKVFKENGYKVVYTDTDSVYVVDPFKDKTKLLETKDKVINDIKASVPFPQDTFDMGIDDEIKYIFFFKGGSKDKESDEQLDADDMLNKSLGFMKKNYLYVAKKFDRDGNYIEDKVVIKNLGIKKKDKSPLARKIFWEHLVPKIKEGQIKFSKTFIKELIIKLLKEDINLAVMRREVGHFEQYKSQTSLPAQIAKKYGSGIHFLIPNTKGIGVGKGKNFCTMEEFKANNLRLEDINLDNVWKELEYFIKPVVTKNIFDFTNK